MTNKPRGLGIVATQRVKDVDMLLAHIYRTIEPQANGERMLEREVEYIGLRVSRDISEARRIVSEILALKE